jgi:VWFA-related protein
MFSVPKKTPNLSMTEAQMITRQWFDLTLFSSSLISWSGRLVTIAIFAICAVIPAQSQSEEVIKFSVDLVTVNVAVKDNKGRTLIGLKPQDFRVTDENSPVIPEFFDSEGPASIVFVIDTSDSMEGQKWKSLIRGLKEFLKKARDNNDYTLIVFGTRARLVAESVSATELSNRLSELKPDDGNTALYDGVMVGLDVLRRLPRRHKAIVLISDGNDNSSRQGLPEVEKEAWSCRTTIYSVGVLLKEYCKHGIKEACHGQETINQLANVSGGLAFFPDSYELPGVLKDISIDVSSQYSLSYYPPDKRAGWREVRVALTNTEQRPKLRYQQRYLMR